MAASGLDALFILSFLYLFSLLSVMEFSFRYLFRSQVIFFVLSRFLY